MHTSERKPVDPNARYEKEDITMDAVKKGIIGFFAFTIAMYPATWLIGKWIGEPQGGLHFGAAQPGVGVHPNRRLPEGANPLLQDNVTATSDMRNMRIEEREHLNSEGVDPKTGKRRVSIQSAIEAEAQRNGG